MLVPLVHMVALITVVVLLVNVLQDSILSQEGKYSSLVHTKGIYRRVKTARN